MEPKFQKGDRVRLLVNHPNNKLSLSAGDIGTAITRYDFDDDTPPAKPWRSIYIVDWGKDVDGLRIFGGPSCGPVSGRMIEPALETEMPELDPVFTDLL